MHDLPEELTAGLRITRATPIPGGDIARAWRCDGPDGPLFLKTHPHPSPRLFEREARGLEALRAAAPPELRVPRVVRSSPRGLVLEWVDQASRTRASEAAFGVGLARLHRTPRPHFGGLDGDDSGYLGSVQVDLAPASSWPQFYVEQRLRPLIEKAVAQGALSGKALDLLEVAAPHAAQLCGPREPAALVHGDLWAGNRMVDTAGRNWLIDPAAHYGHRETDLAMMRLFGGFGSEAWTAYHETYPLAKGWLDRVSWYQLPPLLVHAILFGGGYADSALAVLSRTAASLGLRG